MADISKIKAINGTTYNIKDATARQVMTGATAQANGSSGQVPAPSSSDVSKFLRGDGTWQPVSSGGGSVDTVTMNGTTYSPTSGDINLGTVVTAHRPVSVGGTTINDNNLNFRSGTYTGVETITTSGTSSVGINLNTSSLIGFNDYSATKKYYIGDVVLYNNIMYRCTTATPSGGETWNFAHWTQFKLATDHYAIDDLRQDIAIVEKTSIAQHDISVGEYVIYYGELCRATANIASGDAIGIGTNLTSVMSKGGLNDLRSGVEKIGEIRIWTSATAPSKWKICNGEIISRETYSDLFAVIGTTYGGGDGSTNFAIPDFRGRFAVGAGQSTAVGNTAHTLGQTDGEEKHVLSAGELASHGHSATTSASATTSGKYKKNAQSGSNTNRVDSSGTSSTNAPYTTTVSVSVTVNAYGSNTAHNTMPPYTGINYIIYTGVA